MSKGFAFLIFELLDRKGKKDVNSPSDMCWQENEEADTEGGGDIKERLDLPQRTTAPQKEKYTRIPVRSPISISRWLYLFVRPAAVFHF